MNSPRESVGAAAVRILSRMMNRPRAARLRRFRPVAEPMEARAVLSHVAFTPAMTGPIVIGRGPSSDATAADAGPGLAPATVSPSGPGIGAMVVVNGQVEMQPGEIVVN
jgi:hypothetical protein